MTPLRAAYRPISDYAVIGNTHTAALVGSDGSLTFRELQQAIGRLVHGERWETIEIPQAVARIGATLEDKVFDVDPFIRLWMVDVSSDHYEIDITRATRLLGWRPKRSLRETLPKIIDALKAHPTGWHRSNKLNGHRRRPGAGGARRRWC